MRQGGNHKPVCGVGAIIIPDTLDGFVQAVDHIGIDPERFFETAERQIGFPGFAVLFGGGEIPEAVFRVGEVLFLSIHLPFAGVVNFDSQNRLSGVRFDGESRHSAFGFERERRFGRLGNHALALEEVIHPDLGADLVFGGVLMVVVRRDAEPPLGGFDFLHGGGQVVDAAVKIIGRAQEKNRAFDVFQIVVVSDRRGVEGAVVLSVADSAAGGHDGLHAIVSAGSEHGDFPSHRVAVNPESVGVHFRLLFKKCQRPPRSKGAKEPRAVARRLDGIHGPRRRFQPIEVGGGMPGRGVVGIEQAPLGGDLEIRVLGFAIPEKFHPLGIHMVVGRGDPSRPGDGDRGVAALGIGQHGIVLGKLSAAVNLHQPGKFAATLGVSIHGRHVCFVAFENTDAIPQDF